MAAIMDSFLTSRHSGVMAFVVCRKQNLVYNTSNGIFLQHVKFPPAIVVDNVEFDMLLK